MFTLVDFGSTVDATAWRGRDAPLRVFVGTGLGQIWAYELAAPGSVRGLARLRNSGMPEGPLFYFPFSFFFLGLFSCVFFFVFFETPRLRSKKKMQENMRLTAFFKLYKICILLHRCNLKIFA